MSKPIKSILAIAFLERLAYYLMLSYLVLYLITELGTPHEDASNIYTLFLKGIYILPIIMGLISDIYNRKKMFIIGLILLFLGYLSLGFLSSNLISICLKLFVIASGLSIVRPNILVYIKEFSSSNRTINSGIINYVILAILISLAPKIITYLTSNSLIQFSSPYKPIFYISSGIILTASILYIGRVSRESNSYLKPYQNSITRRNIIFITILLLIRVLFIASRHNFSISSDQILIDFDLIFENINSVFWVFSSLIIICLLLFRKSINIKYSLTIFGSCIVLLSLILGYSELQRTFNNEISEMNILTVIASFSFLEVILLPLFYTLLFDLSGKFKGLVFGIFHSILGFTWHLVIKEDPNSWDILTPIVGTLILGVVIITQKRDNNR